MVAVRAPSRPLRYLAVTCALMVVLYVALFHEHPVDSWISQGIVWYLNRTAACSALVLRALGESVQIAGNTVLGRFPFEVVLDCGALDAQALFVAAVLAFPSPIWTRLLGVLLGCLSIFALNVARLVALYFAGAHSEQLFQTLHEEVFVFLVVGAVCGLFLIWAYWAKRWAARSGGDPEAI